MRTDTATFHDRKSGLRQRSFRTTFWEEKIPPKKTPRKVSLKNEVGLKGATSKVTTDEGNCPEKLTEVSLEKEVGLQGVESKVTPDEGNCPQKKLEGSLGSKLSLQGAASELPTVGTKCAEIPLKENVENEFSNKGTSSGADSENKCEKKNVKVGVKKPLSLNALHALEANKKAKSTTTSKLPVGAVGKKSTKESITHKSNTTCTGSLNKTSDNILEINRDDVSKSTTTNNPVTKEDVIGQTHVQDEVVVEASKKGHCVPSVGNINKETTKYVSSEQDSTGDVVKDTMTKDCSKIVEDRVVVESSDKGPSVVSGTKRPREDVIHNTDTPPSKTKEKKLKGKVVLTQVKGKEKDVPNDPNATVGNLQSKLKLDQDQKNSFHWTHIFLSGFLCRPCVPPNTPTVKSFPNCFRMDQ
ncbi:hypothetical protein AAHA92_05946 [Salvia divinorum]|uniref:Uncharacterized protein n=1 Tax=Salvia divinorum TaxID=28513 RepID=A0ABD1I790_SALDI